VAHTSKPRCRWGGNCIVQEPFRSVQPLLQHSISKRSTPRRGRGKPTVPRERRIPPRQPSLLRAASFTSAGLPVAPRTCTTCSPSAAVRGKAPGGEKRTAADSRLSCVLIPQSKLPQKGFCWTAGESKQQGISKLVWRVRGRRWLRGGREGLAKGQQKTVRRLMTRVRVVLLQPVLCV
jgi:hypothetical protein